MKKLLIASLIIFSISCKKQPKIIGISTTYQVEDFRQPNMDDYETIMSALNTIPENASLQFANKIYTLSHTPFVMKTVHFMGPATITRENQITYTLKVEANENSKFLVLNSTEGLKEADRLLVSLDETDNGATSINVAIKVKGDTIMLNTPLGKTLGKKSNYPTGTKLFKNINFFWVISPDKYPDMSCSFTDLTFDGNRDNNQGSYSWNLNTAVMAVSQGTTTYKRCEFINSPNESIVGHNAQIENCIFKDLNGSAFHATADKQNCTEEEIQSFVYSNIFENTNQISSKITGHSEGAITHSNSGGYYTAKGNKFINVGESVLGAIYPSTSDNDWGTSNIIFSENIIDGAGRMIYLIDSTTKGTIHDVYIEENIISNMNEYDYSNQLEARPGIILEQKTREIPVSDSSFIGK